MNKDDDYDYTPNQRLELLAKELEILNEKLITLGLPDHIQLLRLRLFAEDSKKINTHTKIAGVDLTETDTDNFWRASFEKKHLGNFDTPIKARNAYKQAHIDRYGKESHFHPDYLIDDGSLYEMLPRSIYQCGNDIH